MYNPPTFLNADLLEEILAEFVWPHSFEIETTSDGIQIHFPESILYFMEGFESEISFSICDPNSNEKKFWDEFNLIHYVYGPKKKEDPFFREPIIKNRPYLSPSEEKVKSELRNLCIVIQTYLMDCINGDFSLIDEYNMKNPEARI